MKIHLTSDMHLEMYAMRGIKIPFPAGPACDTVVIAGDMTTVTQCPRAAELYFEFLYERADNIIWVLGNHEFYHGEYDEVIEDASTIAKDYGVHLLDVETNPRVEIDGVKFWGSTLWTDLGNNDWFIANHVREGLNDYYVTSKGDRKLHTDDTFEIYQRTVEQIDWDADVIVTHHCPIGLTHTRFPYSQITHGFCSFDKELEQKIHDSKVKYWLYGHTHDSKNIELNGTIIISNQVGYNREMGVGFDPRLIIEV